MWTALFTFDWVIKDNHPASNETLVQEMEDTYKRFIEELRTAMMGGGDVSTTL